MDSQTHVTGRKSRSFRPLHSFSLRTLFVMVTLLALPLCWSTKQWQIVRERKIAQQWIDANSDQCLREISWGTDRLPLIRRLLGDKPNYLFYLYEDVPETKLAELGRIFPEGIFYRSPQRREANSGILSASPLIRATPP
jgi:hypothetical protein